VASLQVLQNVPHFAVFSGNCSEAEVSEQLYVSNKTRLFQDTGFWNSNPEVK
jgi:hypothetical protein